MSSMGARLGRAFRNFNLENRALREVSKEKPEVAPRHKIPSSDKVSEVSDAIHQRNDPLLSLLKSVYVESKDPETEEPKKVAIRDEERRPLKFSLPGDPYGIVEITDVPKGKLSIVEALKVLNSHKLEPETWTAEKIAEEYSLNLTDTRALLGFFVPFEVKIMPPKLGKVKRLKDS